MSKRKQSLADIVTTYRIIIMALLALPIFGMVVAFAVILYKYPSSHTALIIIAFVAAMYTAAMVVFMKQLDKIAEIDKQRLESMEKASPVTKAIDEPRAKRSTASISLNKGDQLTPEEERIFNIEKKKESDNENN